MCSVELLQSASEFFDLGPKPPRAIIRKVAEVTRTWQAVAEDAGARRTEIARMASAFEHDDLRAALLL